MIQIIRYEKYLFLLLLLIMGIWFYMLNTALPLIGDDMAYCYYYDENSLVERPTSTPITSITQVLPSMWNHYCSVNGRFTSHVLVQFFCGLTGKNVFNVFNTIIFLFFLTIIVKAISRRPSSFILMLTFFFVLFGVSFPGQTMLWLSGSLNYLWPITLSLFILYYIENCKQNKIGFIKGFVFFFTGVFVGWMNESISIGFAGGLFFYFIMNKNRFSGYAKILYLGYVLGTVLIIISPGTSARVTSSGEITTDMNAIQMVTMRFVVLIQMMLKLPVILMSVIALLYSTLKNREVVKTMPMAYIMVVMVLFSWLLGMDEERIYFGLSVIAFVLLLQMLNNYISLNKSLVYVGIVFILAIICFPQCVYAYKETREYANYWRTVETKICKAPKNCVIETTLPPNSSKYVYSMKVSNDRFNFHNRVMAFVYNKNFIQALPHDIYMQYKKSSFVEGLVKKENKADTTFVRDIFLLTNWLMIPVQGDFSVDRQKKCQVLYSDDALQSYQIVIRWLLGTLGKNMKEKPFFYVTHNNKFYYIIPFDGNEINIKLPVIYKSKADYVELIL